MDIKTCRFCRKTFRGFNVLCPSCIEQLDSKYILVRNYLDKNKTAVMSQVAEETGIDDKSLFYLIREGRLSLRGGEGSEIPCMKCGAPISSGKYCDKCKGNLVHALENTISSMESSAKPQAKPVQASDGKGRLHILNNDR